MSLDRRASNLSEGEKHWRQQDDAETRGGESKQKSDFAGTGGGSYAECLSRKMAENGEGRVVCTSGE